MVITYPEEKIRNILDFQVVSIQFHSRLTDICTFSALLIFRKSPVKFKIQEHHSCKVKQVWLEWRHSEAFCEDCPFFSGFRSSSHSFCHQLWILTRNLCRMGMIWFPGHLEGFALYTISYWQKTITVISGETTIILKTQLQQSQNLRFLRLENYLEQCRVFYNHNNDKVKQMGNPQECGWKLSWGKKRQRCQLVPFPNYCLNQTKRYWKFLQLNYGCNALQQHVFMKGLDRIYDQLFNSNFMLMSSFHQGVEVSSAVPLRPWMVSSYGNVHIWTNVHFQMLETLVGVVEDR